MIKIGDGMKKGFTLIELLATIILIGVLALITVPTVTNVIKNVRNKTLNETINNIISSAEDYVIEKDNEYSIVEKSVSINLLKQEGYLPDKIYINPVTGEELTGCVLYKWDEASNQYNLNWSYNCN